MATNWKEIFDVIPINSALSKENVKNIIDTIQEVLQQEWTDGYNEGYSEGWATGKME